MRSKKNLALISVIILFALTALLTIATYNRVHNKNSHPKIADVLGLSLTGLDNLPFTLPNGKKNILLILFEPSCEDCHRQAVEINKNLEFLKDCEIVWISDAPLAKMKEFYETHSLKRNNTSTMARITGNVYETFGTFLTPSLFIFSSEGQLVKAFKGETKIDAILKYIQ
jgi:peroxiredoxin